MSIIITVSVLLPFVIGILLPLSRYFNLIASAVSILTLLTSTILLTIASIPVWQGERVTETYDWATDAKMQIGFRLDPLSALIVIGIAFVGTMGLIFSAYYYKKDSRKERIRFYYSLMNIFIGGMIGVVLATNLIEFVFFWELMLIPSWLIMNYWSANSDQANRASLKYFFYTQLGSVGIIISFALIGYYAQTFDIYKISVDLDNTNVPHSILALIVALLIIGFGVKMAIVPLHNWLPDTYAEAPLPLTVLLSAAMINTAGYALTRFVLLIFSSSFLAARVWLQIFALINIFFGGFLALRENNIVRILGYSSISQMGYILFGLATSKVNGISGGLLQILAHSISKGLLFMIAAIIIKELKTSDIKEMGGISRKMPVITTIAFIGGLNLIGLPPLSGFFSEWLILSGAIYSANGVFDIILVVLLFLGTVLSAAYILRLLWKVFLGPTPEKYEKLHEKPSLSWLPTAVLAILAVLLGIFVNVAIELFTQIGGVL